MFYQQRTDILARTRDRLKNFMAGDKAMAIPPLRPARSPQEHVDGRRFREAFVDYVVAELSRPARAFNDDLLRGFPASLNLTDRTKELLFVEDNADQIADLYNRLVDQASKDTLTFYYLNRALGGLHSHAPHMSQDFLDTVRSIRSYTSGANRRRSEFQWLSRDIYIEEYRVPAGDRIVNLDTHDISALEIFLLNQYTFPGPDRIAVEPGDVVIDGGACWGDTAIYFAAKAFPKGRIFAFEMSWHNIEILNSNLRKNPDLADMVSLIRRPLGSDSVSNIWFHDAGASSRIASEDNGGSRLTTISIDDLVKEQQLDRVDFIKFDIEGAERHALDGAADTITRFAPKLAISAYHLPDDPFVLAQKVLALRPDYRLFLRGVCKNFGETVLFCKPPA